MRLPGGVLLALILLIYCHPVTAQTPLPSEYVAFNSNALDASAIKTDSGPMPLDSKPRLGAAPIPELTIRSSAASSGLQHFSVLGVESPPAFRWREAAWDSFRFLMLEHAGRLAFQAKTRAGLAGPFFKDYAETLRTPPSSFGDGDGIFTNFVAHPVQGAAAYHTARVNGASRGQSFWWGLAYSTQWELGPVSEASIGNVRISPTDLVVTPTLGYALGVTEEWLVAKLARSEKPWVKRMSRLLVPGRFLTAFCSGK